MFVRVHRPVSVLASMMKIYSLFYSGIPKFVVPFAHAARVQNHLDWACQRLPEKGSTRAAFPPACIASAPLRYY